MAAEIAISVENVSKAFKLPHERQTSLKSLVVNIGRRKRGYEKQQVLQDISFSIKKGEFFGIVGRNGSGKSTLLKLLAGIYTPDEGTIQVNGKLTPFIELGVGFNPELTGRENVYLNGSLLGFDHKDMDAMYDDIVDFAELEKFMDQKLKNYSSGMQVRLAFSIAIRAQTDILLVDEVLAVGDAAFQAKCFDYFQQLKEQRKTVVFVSHDRSSLERFCDRGVLIHDGRLLNYGSIQSVLKDYSQIVLGELSKASKEQPVTKVDLATHAAIAGACTTDADGSRQDKFSYGDPVAVRYEIEFKRTIKNPIMGITIWKKNCAEAIYATNTLISGSKKTGTFVAGETVIIETILPTGLNDGEYYVEPALANDAATVFYDQVPKAARFFISGSNNPHSLFNSDQPVVVRKK